MAEKHAIWFVPNYDDSTKSGAAKVHPVSYLRLGSMRTTVDELSTARLRGDDLLERAGFGTPTTSAAGAFFDKANGGVDKNQSGAGTSYQRLDGPGAPVASTESNLTAELMTRGGWRDHTDGNRISTTRGDRVDFVYGNFKRVVFGRQAPTSELATTDFEISGGHLDDNQEVGIAVTSIQWVRDQDGTWKVIQEIAEENVIERFCGRKTEYVDADVLESTVGVAPGAYDATPVMAAVAGGAVLVGFMAICAAASVAAAAQASAGNAAGAVSSTKPIVIAVGGLLLPALALGVTADAVRGMATVDESETPVIRETTWATSITETLEVSGDVTESVTVQHKAADVVHVATSATSEDHARTRVKSIGRAAKPVSFNFEAVLASAWTDTTTFDKRLLVDIGGLSLGLSLVAAEKRVFGNQKDGPWGPSFPFPSVSLTLAVAREAALAAEISFFLGTEFGLTVGNGVALELQAVRVAGVAAAELDIAQGKALVHNLHETAHLLHLRSEVSRLKAGLNLVN
ncbi:MAG: hypothetical protein FJ095_12560 [Deltaproteobacteria bacterium]|nr:hypothetical protein [Deltaproteobacteria bacterium]